jgi:hypothetical protein
MRNVPNKIYLHVGPDVNSDTDFNECSHEDITWSEDRIFENDIVFYRKKGNSSLSKKD